MSNPKTARWWTSPRALLRQVLSLDDTPHSIALGTAIGMFIGLTPTIGIQMALVMIVSVLTSWLFRFNRVAALLTVYLSNPITMVPLYWFNYKVGTLFVAGEMTYEQLGQALRSAAAESWWQALVELFVEIGWPLMVGSAVVSIVGGLLTYPAMLWLIRWFRRSPDLPSTEPKELVTAARD